LKVRNRYGSVVATAAGARTPIPTRVAIKTISTTPIPPGTGLKLAVPEPAVQATRIFAQGTGTPSANIAQTRQHTSASQLASAHPKACATAP
jgi:hypothetical protein